MDIDTGGFQSGLSSMCSDGGGPAVGKHAVLFDPNSTFAQSGLIVVRPGMSILLVGYNIPQGAVFTVDGVSVGSRSVAQGFGCCNDNTKGAQSIYSSAPPDILFRSPMKLGGKTWELTESVDRLLITLPGDYLLVLNDTQYLGNLQVEMVTLPGVTQLPFGYMAGV